MSAMLQTLRLTRFGRVASLSLLWSAVVVAQVPDRFEVVSVRPSAPDARGGGVGAVPGRFSATNYSLLNLLRAAYGVFSPQIIDLPEWARRARYDIQAVTPNGVPVTQDMMRNLLVDRFALRVKQERREMPIYALVRVRSDRLGPHLRPSSNCQAVAPPRCIQTFNSDSIRVEGADWQQLRFWTQLSGAVGRLIVDESGLSGPFDIDLKWDAAAMSDVPTSSAGAVSLFTAMQEQLGLKLDSRVGQVDVLVVERIERPTPN